MLLVVEILWLWNLEPADPQSVASPGNQLAHLAAEVVRPPLWLWLSPFHRSSLALWAAWL